MVYVLLVLGLGFLIFGGDTLVRGAVQLARKLGVSPLLIGLTLVGFGTSTPELITSLLAVKRGAQGIAVGNVVGSNTANILLVLGLSALIAPVRVDLKSFRRDSVFLILSTVGLIVALMAGTIGPVLGGGLVAALLFYVGYSYWSDRRNQKALRAQEKELDSEMGADTGNVWTALIRTGVGIGLTLLGAKFLVDSATELARAWGVSERVIGLTIVAVGTSLPELITSVMASVRRQNDVAFGNVVGSNIYNALFILGATALFMPVVVSADMGADVWIMTGVTAALIGIAFTRRMFSRWVGGVFLGLYALYTFVMFNPGAGL